MKQDRVDMFEKLLAIGEHNKYIIGIHTKSILCKIKNGCHTQSVSLNNKHIICLI